VKDGHLNRNHSCSPIKVLEPERERHLQNLKELHEQARRTYWRKNGAELSVVRGYGFSNRNFRG